MVCLLAMRSCFASGEDMVCKCSGEDMTCE